MAYSARRISVNSISNYITQPNHGFAVGNVVTFNGAAYVLARANSLYNSQGVLMVSVVPDANHFVAIQDGYITQLPTARTPGIQWYLDPVNAGQLTSIIPSSVGNVILPCFVSTNSFEGYFQSNAGQLIESGQLFNWTVVSMNTIMAVNNGYISSSGGLLNMQLPPSSLIGDIIRITNIGGNFKIVQLAGQPIRRECITASCIRWNTWHVSSTPPRSTRRSTGRSSPNWPHSGAAGSRL